MWSIKKDIKMPVKSIQSFFDDTFKIKREKTIALVDADMLVGRLYQPNFALMKISSYWKQKGFSIKLLLSYDDLEYEHIYMSKTFTKTTIPFELNNFPNIKYGGTGFFLDKAEFLLDEIEHSFPDYHLYDEALQNGFIQDRNKYHFTDFSLGFTTRGCFRKCSFCVNKRFDKSSLHSPLSEFVDISRPFIRLHDDNVFACKDWKKVLNDLIATGKPFVFNQGLDIRLMTEEKAMLLLNSNYLSKSYIFAFDNIAEWDIVERGLKIWYACASKVFGNVKWYRGTFYVLMGENDDPYKDVLSALKRTELLYKYRCCPYYMIYEDNIKNNSVIYKSFRGLGTKVLCTIMSIKDAVKLRNLHGGIEAMERLIKEHPDLDYYFNLNYKVINPIKEEISF